jgi:membrane-bound lytic murein transglycosylase
MIPAICLLRILFAGYSSVFLHEAFGAGEVLRGSAPRMKSSDQEMNEVAALTAILCAKVRRQTPDLYDDLERYIAPAIVQGKDSLNPYESDLFEEQYGKMSRDSAQMEARFVWYVEDLA